MQIFFQKVRTNDKKHDIIQLAAKITGTGGAACGVSIGF
jgi:hypothetical protein